MKLESELSLCIENSTFIGNLKDDGNIKSNGEEDLVRAKENIEGQVIGLRSLLRHVKKNPSRLIEPFYDLLHEVLVSQKDLQKELENSNSILSAEVTKARKQIRKTLRTNTAENSSRALYSSERVEQLIDKIRVNPPHDHALLQQILVDFEVFFIL